MKLGTLRDGTRDGTLVVVSRDHTRLTAAPEVARTLRDALDAWDTAEPALRHVAARLESGDIAGSPVDFSQFLSPLPRTWEWVDGSAFLNHVILVRKARNAEPPETLRTDPLVYQGGSGDLLAPTQDIPLINEAWGLDFEAEVAVITGDVTPGTTGEAAKRAIKLITQVNDCTLRNLIPNELAKGFGFFQSKPASAFGPLAVTPDELGAAWDGERLHLRMKVWLDDTLVGDTDTGPEMHFSFADLIGHLAKTRGYCAGTIVGSGTISNFDRARGISCLAERRMIETIDEGKPSTPFLKAGQRVRIAVVDAAGLPVFGVIDQAVVAG
jgi:fumarylacetoacetate (FAA) hydrolase